MDTARWVLGVLLVVMLPPAIVFWYLIHPFAAFWRRVGPGRTFTIVGSLCALLALGLYWVRESLMGRDLGTVWILWLPGLFLYGVSAWISVLTRRELSNRTFVGVPEVSKDPGGSRLLDQGMYGVVRHPRYLSVIMGTAGFAFLVNYLGTYIMVLATVPALWLLIILEERELVQRFGPRYEDYRARVPALLPGFSRFRKDPRKG